METQATNNEVRRHIRPTNVLFNGFLWSYLCCTPGRNYFNIKPSVNFFAPGTHPLSVRWTEKPATWTATTLRRSTATDTRHKFPTKALSA